MGISLERYRENEISSNDVKKSEKGLKKCAASFLQGNLKSVAVIKRMGKKRKSNEKASRLKGEFGRTTVVKKGSFVRRSIFISFPPSFLFFHFSLTQSFSAAYLLGACCVVVTKGSEIYQIKSQKKQFYRFLCLFCFVQLVNVTPSVRRNASSAETTKIGGGGIKIFSSFPFFL